MAQPSERCRQERGGGVVEGVGDTVDKSGIENVPVLVLVAKLVVV